MTEYDRYAASRNYEGRRAARSRAVKNILTILVFFSIALAILLIAANHS